MRYSIMREVPVVVTADGEQVRVPGNQGRVLRLLVLARGRALDKNELALELGTMKPTSVESVISRIRSAIGDHHRQVVRSAEQDGRSGYRIDLDGAEVDAFAFECAVNDPEVRDLSSFEDAPEGFERAADRLRDVWNTWHANPAPDVSHFPFADQAYHEFAAMYDRLGLAVAYSYLRRWLVGGRQRDLGDAIAFLSKLAVGHVHEEIWELLLRAEGSLPSWKHRLPGLQERIIAACGEITPELRKLVDQIHDRNEDVLLLPPPGEHVAASRVESAPAPRVSETELGNLANLAQLVGLSSNSALRLRNSRVEPRECIEQTVQRLWFSGIMASKWVAEPDVRAKFEVLLDRLDGDDEAEVRFLLMDPTSESFKRFRAVTQIDDDPEPLTVLRMLSRRHRSLSVRLYDAMPTFRIVVIDDSLVTVAPYLNVPSEWLKEQGWESPHIVLAPMAPYPLAKSFELLFKEGWRRARRLEDL